MRQHVAAIHVLRGKLGLSDEDYRALLMVLTGKSSTLDMSDAQRAKVRAHMQLLTHKMTGKVDGQAGVHAASFAVSFARATPTERKAWALWNQLHRDGRIADKSARALGMWVNRQVGVQALAWCNDRQLVQVVEALKEWVARGVPPKVVGVGFSNAGVVMETIQEVV